MIRRNQAACGPQPGASALPSRPRSLPRALLRTTLLHCFGPPPVRRPCLASVQPSSWAACCCAGGCASPISAALLCSADCRSLAAGALCGPRGPPCRRERPLAQCRRAYCADVLPRRPEPPGFAGTTLHGVVYETCGLSTASSCEARRHSWCCAERSRPRAETHPAGEGPLDRPINEPVSSGPRAVSCTGAARPPLSCLSRRRVAKTASGYESPGAAPCSAA